MLGILRIKVRVLSLLYAFIINNKTYYNTFVLRVVREVIYLSFINKVNFIVINRAFVLLLFIN